MKDETAEKIYAFTSKILAHPTKVGSDYDMLIVERSMLVYNSLFDDRVEEACNLAIVNRAERMLRE